MTAMDTRVHGTQKVTMHPMHRGSWVHPEPAATSKMHRDASGARTAPLKPFFTRRADHGAGNGVPRRARIIPAHIIPAHIIPGGAMPSFMNSRIGTAVIAATLIGISPFVVHATVARAGSGIVLKRHETKMVEVGKDNGRYEYDASIAPGEAERLYAYRRRATGLDDPHPGIYALPGRKGRFILSEIGKPEGKDFGRRLVLIEKTGAGYKQLSRTRGAADSYNLTPTFFTGGGRVIILAETGTEYSWGLLVHEVSDERLTYLGSLDVAAPGPEDAVDATPYASISLTGQGLRVSFDSDLIHDPGGRKERKITRRNGAPLVFGHDGKNFVLRQ